jgi:PPOX class probable F420-dependent enzyme
LKSLLTEKELRYLKQSRVAHLGTVDNKNTPHLVPIVFANYRDAIYFVIDRKKKKKRGTAVGELKRLRNISNNHATTLLVDHYEEDWSKLSFLLIYCKAVIIRPGEKVRERRRAEKLLKRKYTQYYNGGYFPNRSDKAIFVKLLPLKKVYWQN